MFKIISALTLFISVSVHAQTPDSLLKPSPIKTLTTQQYNALIKGEDQYGMGLVAELNGLPSPDRALKYKKELDLSPTQVATFTKLAVELKRKKIEMGNFIVTNETKLETMFRTKKLNESDLIFYTNRYGLYQGELRNAILQASLKTWQLLSPQQVNKLLTFKKS
ncbi:hypothetical protein [Mucilaginibacter glaciei]|uniref:DUF4142 domain-containing protein n=1 Tax=Mucilaginibacter glaciei TaxID=2772109 RepID=A0A926S5A4_9SPHI|nr:hypothetical protein [Mucilaginibacter glaciei]MBD1392561.1 hypothetical protein [Mucilaginibacter glaciei]